MAEKSMAKLYALQELDKEIWAKRREMKEIPERKAQMEAALDARKASVGAAEEGLKRAQAAQKGAEGDVEALKGQVARFKAQQMSVKTNDEYRAMVKQIEAAEEQIREGEDRVLEAMEGVEGARAALEAERKALASEETDVKRDVGEFLKRAEGLGGEVAELEKRRAERAVEVDGEWLTRYERLFAKHPEGAVAQVEHGTCGGCHMKLSPSQVVETHRDDTLTACAFCGRYLCRGD